MELPCFSDVMLHSRVTGCWEAERRHLKEEPPALAREPLLGPLELPRGGSGDERDDATRDDHALEHGSWSFQR